MDNHEHANHRDTAQARIKNKGIRQHKVNDQAQNIDCCVSVSSPENQNYMSSANDPAINREGYSDLGDQLMQCSHCNANMWEDGYRPDILHSIQSDGEKRKRNRLTMKEWFSYRLQCRSNESKTLLNSRRLFQQFVVDGLLNPLNLKAADRPDIISRVFKLKYEQMLMDLTKNHMLGKVIAYMYTNRVTVVLIDEDNDQTENGGTHNDEIKEYLDCRKPAVERLHFHLPGQHSVLYEDHDDIDDVLSKPSISDSKFISWMNTNQNSIEGRNLTYAEFVSKFVYNEKKRCWHLRKKGYTIGRLLWVPPITGKLFYLRMMLTVCKGPTSFEDLRTIDNVQYSTYKEACFAMGFLQDDKEFIEAIKEAKDWGSTHYIRKLFVLLLLTATMSKPEQVWDQTWHWMADDIVYNYKKSSTSPALQLDDRTLQNLVLLEIEELLQANQRSLRDYPSMPYPEDANCPAYLDNSLILAELNYNNEELRSEFEHLFSHMTAVNKDEGGMFFLYGYGGKGKTYIWKTLASSLRADNKIVIMVASSSIASLLLPGGTQLAKLLNQTSLIIWDETPMAHKFCFEALDHSFRDIIKHNSKDNKIFGGKVMVFGGDFRQILPVIPRGSRSDIVNVTINSSYLWDHCQILRLTKNMRLQNNMQATDQEETVAFAQWIIDIGDGIIGDENNGYATIEIP
ncbi:hypothetical protein D0Y65_041747 [Glycine soja]|uniref:ATP-dependent DNA helicase n=1 Tax=Glycine soja TaxID=3848 RepID=A0A445GX33_GLYSO|nr:hypothetical protein D0Y65_041747 [Glycine soja]